MDRESFFLLFSVVGVLPVALAYGAYPSAILPFLYDIEITNNNLANVFRAIMGFYIASNVLWIAGALNKGFRLIALWSLFIFYSGIGAGRILSIVLDGMPDSIFIMYLIAEILGSAIAFRLIQGTQKSD